MQAVKCSGNQQLQLTPQRIPGRSHVRGLVSIITFVIYDKWSFFWKGPLARSITVDGARGNCHKRVFLALLFQDR